MLSIMSAPENDPGRWEDLARELGLPPDETSPPPQAAPAAPAKVRDPEPPREAKKPKQVDVPAPAASIASEGAEVQAFGVGIFEQPAEQQEEEEPAAERPRRRRNHVSVEQELREVLDTVGAERPASAEEPAETQAPERGGRGRGRGRKPQRESKRPE